MHSPTYMSTSPRRRRCPSQPWVGAIIAGAGKTVGRLGGVQSSEQGAIGLRVCMCNRVLGPVCTWDSACLCIRVSMWVPLDVVHLPGLCLPLSVPAPVCVLVSKHARPLRPPRRPAGSAQLARGLCPPAQ